MNFKVFESTQSKPKHTKAQSSMKIIKRRKWHQCSITVWLVLCVSVFMSVERSAVLAESVITRQITSALRDGTLSPFVIDSDSIGESSNGTLTSAIDVASMSQVDSSNGQTETNSKMSPSEDTSTTSTTTPAPSTTTKSKSNKKASKRKPSPRKNSSSSSSGSTSSTSGNRRKKPHHQQNLSSNSQSLVETVPDQEQLKSDQTCVIGEVCMRNGKLGYCYKPHAPIKYEKDDQDTEDFYEMLQESCSHFFDENENLRHPLCCSPEQEETIARLNANIDLIRRSCPSCLVNVKKLFCNLFCAPNQRDFVRVDRVKGETVMEVTYAMSEQFAQTFFSSCQDVRVFGAYLLDYEYGCGKLKRANCTAVEFMRVLGGLSEIPFNFRPLIVEMATGRILHPRVSSDNAAVGTTDAAEETIIGKEWPKALMNDSSYRCDQGPPNMSPCHCDHCPRMCPANLAKNTHQLTSHSSSSVINSHPHHYESHPSSSVGITSAVLTILGSVLISSSMSLTMTTGRTIIFGKSY